MKQLIRLNTFETNSSSAHTFIIANNKEKNNNHLQLEELNITLRDYSDSNEYALYSLDDKLDYIATAFIRYGFPNDRELFFDCLMETFPNLKSITINDRKMESVENWEQFLKQNEDLEDEGYIDSNSVGLIPSNKDTIKKLLLNDESVIFTIREDDDFSPVTDFIIKKSGISSEKLYQEYKETLLKESVENKDTLKDCFNSFEKNYQDKTMENFITFEDGSDKLIVGLGVEKHIALQPRAYLHNRFIINNELQPVCNEKPIIKTNKMKMR